jgi:hypothetical protein
MVSRYLAPSVFIIALALMGCASGKDQVKPAGKTLFTDVRTVSVSPFDCPDPGIAGAVHSAVIAELLSDYTVVIGEDADVSVTGTITLSPGREISEIRANIIKNGETADCAVISASAQGASESPESLGRKTGVELKEILSGK